MKPTVWVSKHLAARLWDLSDVEVELLCRIGLFRGRKNSCQVPDGWGAEKKRGFVRLQLRTVGGW